MLCLFVCAAFSPVLVFCSIVAFNSLSFVVVAICAGFLAQASADVAGDIGPFQLAILLTIVTLFLILFWPENYGQVNEKGVESSMSMDIRNAVGAITASPAVLFLGLSQAFFEGAVYTFVFLWVPTLLSVNGGTLPTGLVFSSFMLAMTAGI